jgi:cathepsin C
MVASKGFEVNVEGMSFFAFFKFNESDVDGAEIKKFNCSQTMLGWYRNADRTKFGCYYAEMIGEKTASNLNSSKVKSAVTSRKGSQRRSFLQTLSRDTSLTLHQHQEIVEHMNTAQSSWTANVYDHMVGKSLNQLSHSTGTQYSQSSDQMVRSKTASAMSSSVSSSFRNGHARIQERSLPKALDWRNVGGRSFLDSVLDQKECSSSHTISTIRMLSARHRISQNDSSLAPFSVTFPLFCTDYNQGCNGGEAFLAAKWSTDVGLIPEGCDMYNPWGSCEVDHPCVKRGLGFRADNHRYIGGFLGAMPDPDEVLWELYHKGLVVVSINREPSLMYYKSGIYTSVPVSDRAGQDAVDKQNILLVGYGEEHGQKYWIAQNSFGDKWGEQGFFRVARGRNEADVESVAVAADVVKDGQTGVISNFVAHVGESLQMVHPH